VPKEIPVSGSAGQMQQVLVNLVQNAIDSTERQADARLEIRGERRARSAVLTFRDNGTGLPRGHLGQVFDPFFTTKPVGKGTGLGLSISYGIVERHRGQLEGRQPSRGRRRADPDPAAGRIRTFL
jgi:two-component system sensor histidine kinase HupT/HoxJ